ncbi:MarR family transcriptional regulator [Halococcus dombrowskii]|uniref:MarR family transcriptional regulator n=1 Tax=Halococcus dombrowskii TaxID=179637 RepID=A0AAV3SE76_HALDO|nr:MarR family transcriptional regulator [Halococcus dombrowskii]UOO95178.1 MarR family transcriptional regulator [Halococcus dombrowskii]
MGPRASEWLPDLQETLLPTAVRTVRELAHAYDRRILRDERPRLFARKALHQRYDVGTWRSPYPEAITRYTLRYSDHDPDMLDEREREKYDGLKETLTTVGTGRDTLNSGLDMVEETIIPLLQQARPQPTITLVLDGPAWTSVADERTAARALDTIALFSEVCELRLVCSPRLREHLDRHHPEWCDEHLDLTRSRDGWGRTVPGETSKQTRNEAWATISQFDPDGGRLAVLEALSSDSDRTVRELKADPELALADGTIDRYVRELADEHGLIAIDSRPTSNHVTLTETGAAATALLGPDGCPHHPDQSRFTSDRTRTYHDSTSVVCRADRDEESPTPTDDSIATDRTADTAPPTQHSSPSTVPENAPTAEEWLADTGTADDNGYVQWLDGPDGRLDAWAMHERLRAGRRCAGVTVVDDPTQAFEDGEVSYISCFDDHAQVVVQWGGPLPTLVRITNALLSERMFERVLTPATVGDDLDALYDNSLDSAIDDVLRLGAQVGWFSEDEHDYEGLRERYSAVRRRLLTELSTLDRDDPDAWSTLCRDAHGLLASATQLYHASDIDLTIHVRVPDTATLQAGTQRYREFCDFFKHTVPKNAAYGVHSAYRLLYEQRVDKLKHRLGYAFDDDPTAELTASWVVSGPTATTFREDIESAIATNASDVREVIQEGTRRGVGFEIPVVEGNSYAALRGVLDRQAARKGFTLDSTDRRESIRLATATLGTEPGRCSPYAFAEALLAIARTRTPTATLSPTDVAYGLTQLPADRLVPSLPPTMQTVLKTLLVADDPLGQSTIVARAGISRTSYNRNIDELAALGMVEATGNGGHRKWQAWLIPWWSPLAGVDAPRTVDGDESTLARPSRWDDILYETTLNLGLDHDDELFTQPIDIGEIFTALPQLDRWRGFFEAHYGRGAASAIADNESGSSSDRQSTDGSIDTTHSIEIGAHPAGREDEQRSLDDSS